MRAEVQPSGAVGAILFDLDGTLADTLPGLLGAMNDTLVAAGHAPTAAATLRPAVSGGTAGMVEVSAPGATPAVRESLAVDFLDAYAAQPGRDTTLFPGMAETLAGLHQRGIPWGIVTNKRARFTTTVVDALGVTHSARCVISGDTAARPKPAPDPLLLGCRELGVAAGTTVYVGDAAGDVVAAQAAGMVCLLARWGYIAAHDEADRWGADGDLDTPTSLLEWIDARRTL